MSPHDNRHDTEMKRKADALREADAQIAAADAYRKTSEHPYAPDALMDACRAYHHAKMTVPAEPPQGAPTPTPYKCTCEGRHPAHDAQCLRDNSVTSTDDFAFPPAFCKCRCFIGHPCHEHEKAMTQRRSELPQGIDRQDRCGTRKATRPSKDALDRATRFLAWFYPKEDTDDLAGAELAIDCLCVLLGFGLSQDTLESRDVRAIFEQWPGS